MAPENESTAPLKRLLHLCTEVEVLTELLRGGTISGKARRVRARKRDALRSLKALVDDQAPPRLPTWFSSMQKDHGLRPDEALLLAFLLNRRIASSHPVLEGRELLQLLTEDSFELIRYGALLHREAPLLSSGLVDGRLTRPEASLEGEFRIAERLYRQVYRRIHQIEPARRSANEAPAYGSPLEHLLDCEHLVTLHQKRAAIAFPQSYWAEVHPEVEESPRDLNEAVEQARHLISRREEATEQVRLPLVEVREEFSLGDDEETMLLTVLFQEYYSATALVEGAELLRLVAADEEELFRKRSLLSATSTIQDAGLLAFDIEIDEKDLLAGAYMPEWLVERLLDGVDAEAVIDTDEQRRFRDFLEQLDSSEDFYRNL